MRPVKIHTAQRLSPIDWARRKQLCFMNRSVNIMLRAAVILQAMMISAILTSEKQFILN